MILTNLVASVSLTVSLASATAGSGTVKSESRPLAAFTHVAAAGSFTVDIVAGDKLSADVTADDNLLPLIVTEVKDGVLTIKEKDKSEIKPSKPVLVKVTAKSLESLTASGSGKTSAVDVPAKALALTLSGSGQLSWKGAADAVALTVSGSGGAALVGKGTQLTLTVSGSGDTDASAFEVPSATVTVAGSGKVQVNAAKALTANISGAGRVVYSGAPAVTKNVTGSGAVEAKDAPAAVAPKKAAGW